MDMITLAAARKYVNDTANALGAVKGSPCTIKSITETDEGATIEFSWTGSDGVEQTNSTFLPRGPQGEKGEKGDTGKDGSGTVDTVAREQITALTEEMLTTEAKAELAALCPDIFSDPDVNILYDPDRTEVAASEFESNTDIEVVYFPNVETIYANGFRNCTSLRVAIFPKAKIVGISAFSKCTQLETIMFPNATSNDSGAFDYCSALKKVSFPAMTTIFGFVYCTAMEKAEFAVATTLATGALRFNEKLTALILRSQTLCTLQNKSAIASTPIASGTGYIYVPSALIEDYKVAANWSTYAAQFRAIEDYPDICAEDADECITKAEAAALIDSKLGVIENGTY